MNCKSIYDDNINIIFVKLTNDNSLKKVSLRNLVDSLPVKIICFSNSLLVC